MPAPHRIQGTPRTAADHSDTLAIQRKLVEMADRLSAMADDLAVARQVREWDSDRRKKVLAVAAAPLLSAGESATAAETQARASQPYDAAMRQLAKELIAAEKVIANWEATRIQWESARSLLSMSKSQMGLL